MRSGLNISLFFRAAAWRDWWPTLLHIWGIFSFFFFVHPPPTLRPKPQPWGPNSSLEAQIPPWGQNPLFEAEISASRPKSQTIPHMCESIGRQPLQGHCPAPVHNFNHNLLRLGTGTTDHLSWLLKSVLLTHAMNQELPISKSRTRDFTRCYDSRSVG